MITDAPNGWPLPTDAQLDIARARVLEALAEEASFPAIDRLTRYYDRRGNYAGTSFVEMRPTAPNTVETADLHAVTLLGGRKYPPKVEARATRRLLGDDGVGGHSREVSSRLEALDPTMHLNETGEGPLRAMSDLFQSVKGALDNPDAKISNPWVVASKLCARKRPLLFPVRDNKVCEFLGLLGKSMRGRHERDYLVYRELISDPDVYLRIDQVCERVRALGADHRPDQDRLRVLDVALWTYVMWQTPTSANDED